MINLRSKEDMPINLLMLGAILVMVGAAAYSLLVPLPSAERVGYQQKQEEFDLKLATKNLEKKAAEADAAVQKYVWSLPTQEIGAAALDRLSTMARARQLKLAVRPQRADDDGKIITLPFSMTVEGSYPQVLAFVRDLDSGVAKLAVTVVQVTSADGASDHVTATVGVAAFKRVEEGGEGA